MRTRVPDVAPWLLTLRYRPECWDERTTVLVDRYSVQSYVDVFAEARNADLIGCWGIDRGTGVLLRGSVGCI
jgi:hypothetical protein